MPEMQIDRDHPDFIKGNTEFLSIVVLRDSDDAQIKHRRGIKLNPINGSESNRVSWPIAELNGVKLYFVGENELILTTQELRP